MDACRLLYAGSCLAYMVAFYARATYPFMEFKDWPGFIFLGTMFLLIDQYQLVPAPLTCPLLYPFYKAAAAIVVVNLSMLNFLDQMEDFLAWTLAGLAKLFQYVPGIKRTLGFGVDERVLYGTKMLLCLYFLFWVVYSSEFIQRLRRSGVRSGGGWSPSAKCAPAPNQLSRSKSRTPRRGRC